MRTRIERVERFVAAGVQTLEVQMLVVGKLGVHTHHCGDTDVGTDVGDPVKLHHQVRKRRIGIGVAFAGAHAFQMVPAEHGNEIGGHLHERLDPRRGVDVSETAAGENAVLFFFIVDAYAAMFTAWSPNRSNSDVTL